MERASFWDERVKTFGHTGWSNPMIYAYDQAARINAIEQVLSEISLPQELALDFGCGVGDFSNRLSHRFQSVMACDISQTALEKATQRNGRNNIHYCLPEEIGCKEGQLSLFLSITVLGHIMQDSELEVLLSKAHGWLHEGGAIVALEFAPEQIPSQSSDYQKFRAFDAWKNIFDAQGFELAHYWGFYHPTLAPCRSFTNYKNKVNVRFWRILNRFFKVSHRFENIADHVVRNAQDYYWPGTLQDPMKIMVFKKK